MNAAAALPAGDADAAAAMHAAPAILAFACMHTLHAPVRNLAGLLCGSWYKLEGVPAPVASPCAAIPAGADLLRSTQKIQRFVSTLQLPLLIKPVP